MGAIIDVILPVFGMVALGYAATFTAVFDAAAARGLANFVFYFALPASLFQAMATITLPGTPPVGFLLSYYLSTALMFVPAFLMFSGPMDRQAMLGFGSAFSNTVLLGAPLVITALGPEASLPIFLIISFHSAVFFSLLTLLIEGARGAGSQLWRLPIKLARALATNLFLVTIIAGLAFTWAGLKLPTALDKGLGFLAQAALPGALFSMGAALRRYKLTGAMGTAARMSAVKLVLHPLTVWLAVWLFGVEGIWAKTAILCAGMPMGVNSYLFAVRYQVVEAETATAILMSNILAFGSLAVILHLIGVG